MRQKGLHMMIAKLMADPSLTQHQIAKTLGISRSTVARASQQIHAMEEQAGISDSDSILKAYQQKMLECVTISDRVQAVADVVKHGKRNPFARLRGVEYADKIGGYVAPERQSQEDSRPMFVINNAQINFGDAAHDVVPELPTTTSSE